MCGWVVFVIQGTKSIILHAFMKMANTYTELKGDIERVFQAHMGNFDCELQQRVRTLPFKWRARVSHFVYPKQAMALWR